VILRCFPKKYTIFGKWIKIQAVKKYDKDLGLILGRYLLLCGAALSAGFVSYKIKNKVALYDKARGYLGSILGLIELIEKQNSSIMTPVGFNLKNNIKSVLLPSVTSLIVHIEKSKIAK